MTFLEMVNAIKRETECDGCGGVATVGVEVGDVLNHYCAKCAARGHSAIASARAENFAKILLDKDREPW